MTTTARILALATALLATASAPLARAAPGDDAPERRIARALGGNDLAMPPELIEKLSPDQLMTILREREEGVHPGGGVLVPIVFFATLAAIVLLAQMFATRRERMRQETLRALLEKGVDVPADLVAGRAGAPSDLRRGLVLVGAGLGLAIALAVVGRGAAGLWSVGLVPVLMGAGYLAAWRIETRDRAG